jgi:hypothetical protein
MPMLTEPAATWLRPVPLLVGVCCTVALGFAASKPSFAAATKGSNADDPFKVTVPLTGDVLGDAELVVVLLLPQAASRSMAPAAMLGKR